MRKALGLICLAAVALGAAYLTWRHSTDPEAGFREEQLAEPAAAESSGASSGFPPARPSAPPAAAPAPADPQAAAVAALLAISDPDAVDPAMWQFVERADSNTVAALARALETETDLARLELISRALNEIGTEESFRVFRDFLSRPENVRYCEHLAGALISLMNEELSDEVLDWMLDIANYDVAMACRDTVGRLATEEVVARIVAEHGRTNYNDYMLGLMRTSLENSECPEALDLLRGVLENPPGRPTLALQAAAARALANIGSRPAIDALVAALAKSTRAPTNDFLVAAVAGLHASYNQAYLQELFDTATAFNVKYALGLALAQTLDSYQEPPEEEGLLEEDLAEPEEASLNGGIIAAPADEKPESEAGTLKIDLDGAPSVLDDRVAPPAEAGVD